MWERPQCRDTFGGTCFRMSRTRRSASLRMKQPRITRLERIIEEGRPDSTGSGSTPFRLSSGGED
jgi:hypothetical protein